MIICIPFSYMNNYYWHRYKEQLLSLSNNCDGLFIPVNRGVYPDELKDYPKINMYIWQNLSYKKRNKEKNKHLKSVASSMIKSFFYFNRINRVYNLSKIYSKFDYDVVLSYSGGGWMELLHIRMAKEKGVKCIHRMRGYGRLERYLASSRINRFFSERLDRYAWLSYDYHIPINYEYKCVLKSFGIPESKISEPIELGVDTNMFRPLKYDSNKGLIGYFGRIAPEKNIDLLIDIMKETPDTNYIVAGKKSMKVSFPDNVEYLGSLQKHELNYYYNMCKAILLPSYAEGLSNVIYETYATGRILIASKNALNKMFPIYGYRMNGFNVKDWVKVINGLSDINFDCIGMKAREWALKKDWNCFGKKMVNALRKVMQ